MSTFSFRNRGVALRAFEPADAPAFHAYLNDPALTGRRYLPDGFPDAVPLSIHQAEGVIAHWQKETESWTLAIVAAASGELLGHARTDWEWDPHCPSACAVVAPAHQRRGVGSAALAIALAFLFQETPAHVVSCWTASWNDPALSFMRRSGFHEAGRRPRGGVHAGVFYSDVAFDLLRPEWSALKEGRHVA
ncbi:MAG: GNAT family protein [Candidatus Bipolaricaulota bacterium]|nr:GNAT family protein [Candidatus Bipolaricaulota bacterium]